MAEVIPQATMAVYNSFEEIYGYALVRQCVIRCVCFLSLTGHP